MSTTVSNRSETPGGGWANVLTADFCPGLNKYVYWMKEPIGWFVAAALVSTLVGIFLSPIGWALAAGLVAIIFGGLLFPWLAVRFTICRLEPVIDKLTEREASQLVLTVVNPLPIPLWGLAINGYLTDARREESGRLSVRKPEISLSGVPMLSEATFRLPIQAEYRGHYPIENPEVACAFPFGIWTARRKLTLVRPVTVWPMMLDLPSLMDLGGRRYSDIGVGLRAGSHGDFLGVRPFRQGDTLRSIHWVQSARMEKLVVCERAAPQQQEVLLTLDTQIGLAETTDESRRWMAQENLAWRVRIGASLANLFDAQHVPFRLRIGLTEPVEKPATLGSALDQLAAIPLLGMGNERSSQSDLSLTGNRGAEIRIFHVEDPEERYVRVEASLPGVGRCGTAIDRVVRIDLDGDIRAQLLGFLRELGYVNTAA